MWLKWIISIGLFCFTLLVLQYISLRYANVDQVFVNIFYSTIKESKYNPGDSINLGFSLFEFEQAKLREKELERDYDLTAILLHWKRLKGVQKSIEQFIKTRLFKQIIIWNNNPRINLTIHHLIKNNDSSQFIRIINSKRNLKDEAKYRACAEATTRACFYVDDDWDTSHYIKSLIASFRSDPNLLHSITDSYTFYTNLVWSYFDPTIDLHTGFSWIGCGSVFLRKHAQRHLQLIYKFLGNDPDFIHLSDVFFSIWLNNIPSQMNTNIRYMPSTSPNDSLPSQFSALQYTTAVVAVRILERSLSLDQSKKSDNITFPRQENRRFPYYVKSPSFNDDFIFYSNVLPFELENVPFNNSRDFQRDSNVRYFSTHNTWQVVDGDLSTCWHANRVIQSGDFFAVDFLYAQTNITFILTVTHSVILQKSFDLSISFDGLWWLSYRSYRGIFIKKNQTLSQQFYSVLFDSTQFAPGFESFRYISFKTIKSSEQRLQVCDIQMVSEKNIDGIMHDFEPLDISIY